jgi:hypothetical protein
MLDSDAYIAHLVAIWTFSRLGALPPTNASIGLGLWGGHPVKISTTKLQRIKSQPHDYQEGPQTFNWLPRMLSYCYDTSSSTSLFGRGKHCTVRSVCLPYWRTPHSFAPVDAIECMYVGFSVEKSRAGSEIRPLNVTLVIGPAA